MSRASGSSACTPRTIRAGDGMNPLKLALNIIGGLALVLGIVGIFLPLVPTTPFLLLASACFMRGSERLHRRLLANPYCGKIIRDYEEKRAVPRRAKVMGIGLLWISMSVSIYMMTSVWPRVLLAAIGVAVTIYLLRLRTIAPGE